MMVTVGKCFLIRAFWSLVLNSGFALSGSSPVGSPSSNLKSLSRLAALNAAYYWLTPKISAKDGMAQKWLMRLVSSVQNYIWKESSFSSSL